MFFQKLNSITERVTKLESIKPRYQDAVDHFAPIFDQILTPSFEALDEICDMAFGFAAVYIVLGTEMNLKFAEL